MVTKSYKAKTSPVILAVMLIACLLMGGCADTGVVRKKRILMGTVVEVAVADLNLEKARKDHAVKKAFTAVERVNGLMSTYDKDSDIYAVNEFAYVRPVQVELDTIKVILAAERFYNDTNGAFDITVGPLVKLWGFGAGAELKDMPADEQISKALENVGMDKLRVNAAGRKITFLRPEVKIDLSAIAKGFAVDKAIEALREEGVSNAMVNAGGDIRCIGGGPWNKGWRVGIRHPRMDSKLPDVIKPQDAAVATSGDYENFFFWNKKRFSHIIDPRTGRPTADRPASVTVIAPDCATADALATAVFVMGPEEGIRFLEERPGTEGMIISADGAELKIVTTKGFNKGEEG